MAATRTGERRVHLKQLLLTILIVMNFNASILVDAYGRGAPEIACSNMTPRHGPNAQISAPPFSVAALKTTVEPGGVVTVRIQSTNAGVSFKGFFLQAVDADAARPSPIGSFATSAGNSRIQTCSPGLQNALTHADSAPKSLLEFTWQAPADFQGDVLFKCTFVRDFAYFWPQVPAAQRVRVSRSLPVPQATTTTLPPNPQPIPDVTVPTTTASTTTTTATAATTSTTSTTPSTTSTTTTAKTTSVLSTNSWRFTTQEPAPTIAARPVIYEGCGDTKGCFGMPANCADSASCNVMVSYAVKGFRYEFELWAANAAANSYVAVGFSKDAEMGDDSVTECSLFNNRVNVFMSFNAGKSNSRLRDPLVGLSNVELRHGDGNLYCKFTRESPFVVQNITFDLSSKLNLLLATGSASESGIQYHRSRIASASPVSFAQVALVQVKSNTSVKVHGALMVSAWLGAASLGILIARYYRQTWVGKQLFNKDIWFIAHQSLMACCWLLTIIGFIVIFVEINGWTTQPDNRHALVGCITTGLAFIQPFMAYFRPHPGTSKRFIFNWAHWLVGNTAHILAIVCMFLAVDLNKAALPFWANWLLVTYVAFHAVTHLVLSVAQCCYHADGSRKSTVVAMKDLAPHQTNQTHFYSTQQDRKEDAHGSKYRRLMLATYVLVVISVAVAIVATIVTA